MRVVLGSHKLLKMRLSKAMKRTGLCTDLMADTAFWLNFLHCMPSLHAMFSQEIDFLLSWGIKKDKDQKSFLMIKRRLIITLKPLSGLLVTNKNVKQEWM